MNGKRTLIFEVPEVLMKELQRVGDFNYMTVTEVVRAFIKLGLVAQAMTERDDGYLALVEGDEITRLDVFARPDDERT